MADKVRGFSAAAEAAGLPKRIKMEELAALGEVTYLSAFADSASLPDGTSNDGYVVTVSKGGKEYDTFIGAKVLVGALARLEFPFTARLAKSGRSWIFTD